MRGKIEKIDKDNKKVTIKGQEYQIGKKTWNVENFDTKLEEGIEIEFNLKGANFEFVKLYANGSFDGVLGAKKTAGGFGGGIPVIGAGTFNYPYNFVKNDFKKSIRNSYKIKGKNSGEISFTVLNTSPFLIPQEENGVKMPLKSEKGEYIIPASSLKGLIKNNFETITNSCFSVIEDRAEKNVYDFRKDFNRDDNFHKNQIEIVPARVIEKEGKHFIEKLSSAWINDKALVKDEKDELDSSGNPKKCVTKEVIENFKWEKLKGSALTINIVNTTHDSSKIKTLKGKHYSGYIKDTGINFGNAHHQRFFYYKDTNNIETFEVHDKVLDKYKVVLARQKEENRKNYKPNGGKNPWITTYHHTEAKSGSLLWAIVEKSTKRVLALSYVETPKITYYNGVEDLLDKLNHCNDINNLCYACRVFGTVIKKDAVDENVALKGKVEFFDLHHSGVALISGKALRMDILDAPEPANAGFYVDKEHNSYDEPGATIRGRKFYWNHSDKQGIKTTEELEKSKIINASASGEQSSLVKPFLSGNSFIGKVRFKDLSDEELGALLLAFGNENSLHKLGAGKPLGMGSIKIENIKLNLDSKDKYNSFSNSFIVETEKGSYINSFKEFMKSSFGKDYSQISFVKEFESITNKQINFSKENYPTFEKFGEKNSLLWFMENKKNCKSGFKLPNIQDYK